MSPVRTHVETDIRGYGPMLHRLGEAEAEKRMRIYERIVRQRLPDSSIEHDHIGDSFHLVFRAPRQAVRTALDIAEALAKHNARHPERPLSVGIGIDTGESTKRGTGFTGAAPIVAVRLARRATWGQVLLSGTVRAFLANTIPLRDLGMWKHGSEPPIHVFEGRAPDQTDGTQVASDRILAALFFTDIVQSTATAMALGAKKWRETVERHHTIVRESLERFGGNEIDTAGDGFYASFDTPSQAIQCGLHLRERIRAAGVAVRVGVHVGECEVVAGKIGGVAAAVGGRVKDLAQGGEVLVSQTVRDLLVGTTFTFEERGRHALKGVPGEWEIYAVGGGSSA